VAWEGSFENLTSALKCSYPEAAQMTSLISLEKLRYLLHLTSRVHMFRKESEILVNIYMPITDNLFDSLP
jgi:hypothetical protein